MRIKEMMKSVLLLVMLLLTPPAQAGFDFSKSTPIKGDRCLWAVLSTLSLQAGIPQDKVKDIMDQSSTGAIMSLVYLNEKKIEWDYMVLGPNSRGRVARLREFCKKNTGVGVCIQGVFDWHAVTVLEVGDAEVKYVDPNDHKRISTMNLKVFDERWQGHIFIVYSSKEEKIRRSK